MLFLPGKRLCENAAQPQLGRLHGNVRLLNHLYINACNKLRSFIEDISAELGNITAEILISPHNITLSIYLLQLLKDVIKTNISSEDKTGLLILKLRQPL